MAAWGMGGEAALLSQDVGKEVSALVSSCFLGQAASRCGYACINKYLNQAVFWL